MKKTLLLSSLLLLGAGLVACDGAVEPTDTTPAAAPSEGERRANLKADFIPVGTCEGACDGFTQTPGGNCWCDELCTKYGDCCADKAELCDVGGCSTDADCATSEYCAEIQCFAAPCPPGMCNPKGDVNDFCTANNPCLDGLACINNKCTELPKTCLITGCSGQVCSDEDTITTCEYKPEYACYKAPGASCDVQADGECGWTITGQAAQCFEDFSNPDEGCATDSDCEAGQYCQEIQCFTTPCINPCVDKVAEGGECAADNWCEEGLTCEDGTCSAEGGCATDADCAAGEFCMEIVCITTPCNNPCVEKIAEGGDCAEDSWCQDGLSCVDGSCVAPKPPCVVSGCSGQICGTEPVNTTCEWKDEYACYKEEGASCEIQADGSCGWTMDGAAGACIEQYQCDEYICTLWCEHGFQKDDKGCDTCLCNPAPESACSGHCGGEAPEGCWCDSYCAYYGDCCEGKADVCE